MKYYTLIEVGDLHNHPEYCVVKGSPSVISDKTWSLSIGRSLKAFYPDDPFEVTLPLDQDRPGLKFPPLLETAKATVLIQKDVIPVLKEAPDMFRILGTYSIAFSHPLTKGFPINSPTSCFHMPR